MDDDDAQHILEVDRRWVDAFNAREIEPLVEIYAEDAVLMPPGDAEIIGRQAIRRFLEQSFENADIHQELMNDEVKVCGDLAFIRGRFRLTTIERGSELQRIEDGKHLVIWQRSGEGWRASHDIWNITRSST